ncbi:MAG: S-adenosylmethionine:tRNA ribosyltransferase-isomerase, partial [Spirochaetaceae bacterium]|nr:S-adenosylmethionine:tRNA ribosyltransferase-isomerase [Spirochaetaceae bacterium]
METKDFFFDLPEELIAKYPPEKRGESRLMMLNRGTGQRRHCMAAALPELLAGPEFRSPDGEAPLLVFNNSRVRKARLKAKLLTPGSGTVSGGAAGDGATGEAEFLLLNRIDSRTWRTMVNRAKRRRPKQRFCFSGGLEGEIVEAPGGAGRPANNAASGNEFRYLRFDSPIDDDWLDVHGRIPLPPYIKRDDEPADGERYQTVYADRAAGAGLGPGASTAAPTAGLHFTEELLALLRAAGIESVFITLHVGPGTFLPVRTRRIEDHVMHEEAYTINSEAARRINAA